MQSAYGVPEQDDLSGMTRLRAYLNQLLLHVPNESNNKYINIYICISFLDGWQLKPPSECSRAPEQDFFLNVNIYIYIRHIYMYIYMYTCKLAAHIPLPSRMGPWCNFLRFLNESNNKHIYTHMYLYDVCIRVMG